MMTLRNRSGVRFESMAELAGVAGPYPSPIASAPTAMTAGTALTNRTIPPAAHSRHCWLTRTGPLRTTRAPPSGAAYAAATNTRAVKIPIAVAVRPISACAAGANTAGAYTAIAISVWASVASVSATTSSRTSVRC